MTAGQTASGRSFGQWGAPRLQAVLVLCGMRAGDARRCVERAVASAVARPGEAGFGPEVTLAVLGGPAPEDGAAGAPPHDGGGAPSPLDAARPVTAAPDPARRVTAALATLAWPERVATVAALTLDQPMAGTARQSLLAARLGVAEDDLAEIVRDALAQVTPPPDPGLVERVRRRRGRTRTAAVIGAAALVVAAAGTASWAVGRDPKPGTPANGITQWVAVLAYGPDAFSLAGPVGDVGRAVGVYAFTDRWSCYQGLPERAVTADDDWFLGIAAPDRALLDELVARSGRTALAEAEVRATCVLPPPADPPAPG